MQNEYHNRVEFSIHTKGSVENAESVCPIMGFSPGVLISLVCCCLVAKSCPTLWEPLTARTLGKLTARLLCTWDFPGKDTGVGCHFLLQGIFLTQGLNLCLLHCQADSLLMSHQRGPLITLSVVTKVIDS